MIDRFHFPCIWYIVFYRWSICIHSWIGTCKIRFSFNLSGEQCQVNIVWDSNCHVKNCCMKNCPLEKLLHNELLSIIMSTSRIENWPGKSDLEQMLQEKLMDCLIEGYTNFAHINFRSQLAYFTFKFYHNAMHSNINPAQTYQQCPTRNKKVTIQGRNLKIYTAKLKFNHIMFVLYFSWEVLNHRNLHLLTRHWKCALIFTRPFQHL